MPDSDNSEKHEIVSASIYFGVVIEQNQTQRVRCEIREGYDVFVFDGGGKQKTIVPADTYLEILAEARANKTESNYGIPNDELV